MEEKDICKALLEKAPEGGRISCAEARELADKLGVHPSEIGKACNVINVKIVACELGCF